MKKAEARSAEQRADEAIFGALTARGVVDGMPVVELSIEALRSRVALEITAVSECSAANAPVHCAKRYAEAADD